MQALFNSAIWRTLTASGIVFGSCVGASLLALPVVGAEIGFLPSLLVMISTYLLMTLGGLFYGEIAQWFPKEAHLVSITRRFVGPKGTVAVSLVYLLLGIGSLIAYLGEAAHLIQINLAQFFALEVSYNSTVILLGIFLTGVLLCGTRLLSLCNFCFVAVMIGAYFLLSSHVGAALQWELWQRADWQWSKMALLYPVMLASFSYPGIVPALSVYLDRDASKLRLAIVLGTSMTLIIYITWMALVFGVVPFAGAPVTLQAALAMAIQPLRHCSNSYPVLP